jgi:hypothetical protein
MKCIILSANAYSMKDEVTGKVNSGVSVFYLPTNSLLPVVDENGLLGVVPCKDSVDLSMSGEFTQVPGIYEVEMGVKAIKGRAMMKIVSAKFVSTIITEGDRTVLDKIDKSKTA